MAIYIQLNVIDDDPSCAIYEFGPVDAIVGTVAVDKQTGETTLIQIDDAYKPRSDFYLSRIETVLRRHHTENCYPDRTWYAP